MADELPSPPHDELPPLSHADLKALFDDLDCPNPAPCTHTFRGTVAFLKSRKLPVEATVEWLQSNGAGCDCEVIFNTDAEWGEWAGVLRPARSSREPVAVPNGGFIAVFQSSTAD